MLQVQENQSAQDGLLGFRKQLFLAIVLGNGIEVSQPYLRGARDETDGYSLVVWRRMFVFF
jgi:hypothetical protein